MIDVRSPRKTGHVVAIGATGGITGLGMVGTCRCSIIRLVAIITKHTQWFETKFGSGFMAFVAIGCEMRSNKRKTALLVDLRDVVDDP